jgi:hypothetical protein
MRKLSLLCSVLLLSALAFGQSVVHGYPGYCPYGCGPYVPLLTTPQLWLSVVSPNPVGATNATGGLFAGATNSTLSQVSGDIDAVYTLPVWLSGGGAPLVSPAVNAPFGGMKMEHMEGGERMHHEHEAAPAEWVYFSSAHGSGAAQMASAAKGLPHARHAYSNDDVARQNQKNGFVKYDARTLKIQ